MRYMVEYGPRKYGGRPETYPFRADISAVLGVLFDQLNFSIWKKQNIIFDARIQIPDSRLITQMKTTKDTR